MTRDSSPTETVNDPRRRRFLQQSLAGAGILAGVLASGAVAHHGRQRRTVPLSQRNSPRPHATA